MNTKNYKELLQSMQNHAIASQSKVTDFNEGSIIMTIFESVARVIEQQYIDTRNGYSNNLRAIPYSVFDFQKKNGTKAGTKVKFSRGTVGLTAATVPSGTIISDGTYNFITTETATIAAGSLDSNLVAASAENVGLVYNVGANTITVIETNLAEEIVAVTNPERALGGSNEESSTEMLARFKSYINGLQGSNNYGIKSGVLAIEGVRSVGIQEHFPPRNDVYNMTIYIDDGTGSLTDTLKTKIRNVVDGDGTSDYPGLRAAGINVDIQGASIIYVDIDVHVQTSRIEDAVAKLNIQTKLQEYIDNLNINENVVISSLTVLLKQISGLTDVTSLKLNGSSSNIAVGVNQIARFNTVTITIEQ